MRPEILNPAPRTLRIVTAPARTWGAWLAAALLILPGLLCLPGPEAAVAQERTLRAEGRHALGGLAPQEARALAIGGARLELGKQVAAALGGMGGVKSMNPSPDAVAAVARVVLPVTVQDGAPGADGVTVTVQTTFDPAVLQLIARKMLVDEDLMQRLLEASRGLQSAVSAAPSSQSAKLLSAHHEYLNGLAQWLTGGAQGLNPAIDAFTRAVTDAPDFAPAWTARGAVRIGLSQLDTAMEDLNKGVSLDPKSDEALRARAAGYMAGLRYAQAEADLNAAIQIDPQDASSRNARGELQALLKRNERALQDLDEAIRLAPNYAIAHYNRGAVLGSEQKMESALREYDTALRLDPALTLALNNRANLLARTQQYDKALKDLDEAIRLDAEFAAAFNNRGEVYRAMGKSERAIQDFDEAIKHRPTYANAYINRAAALQQEGKVDLAFKDLEFAVKLVPANANIYASRGSAYARLSLPAKACQDWKKACELGDKAICEFLQKPDVCEAELPEN